MRTGTWEHLEHDADIGLRAAADSREELFRLMAEALTALVAEPGSVRPVETINVSCEAPDDALLMVDWLNTLIFEMATRKMLFSAWQVRLDDHRLVASVSGEAVDRRRHKPVVEVKGATYTSLSVAQGADGIWHGQCVVDV